MSSNAKGVPEATPRPWRLEDDDWRHVVTEIDGAETEIATVWEQRIGEGKCNAELIVTAVNSYDALQAANKSLREACEAALLAMNEMQFGLAKSKLRQAIRGEKQG